MPTYAFRLVAPLFGLARQKGRERWQLIFERHFQLLYLVAGQLAPRPSDVEEALGKTFVQLCADPATWQLDEAQIRTWLLCRLSDHFLKLEKEVPSAVDRTLARQRLGRSLRLVLRAARTAAATAACADSPK